MIALRGYDLAAIAALAVDATRWDDLVVVDGALAPDFLIEAAVSALASGAPPMWFAPFAFVDVAAGEVVGTGGFKGLPVDGAVELGYSVAPTRRGRGHATAGVRAMVALAFGQSAVDAVIAETAIGNDASRRVVLNAGFAWVGRRDTDDDGVVDRWRLDRQGAAGG